jgi:putative transposase
LFKIHVVFVKGKYRDLFTSKTKRKPGPKDPTKALIQAILESKRRNPSCGCPRIAQLISDTFGIELDRDEVRRGLMNYLKSTGKGDGPSLCRMFNQAVAGSGIPEHFSHDDDPLFSYL